MALSHKKKTAGRPPDWPKETDSDAEWEQLSSNEVIWEEMINGSGNVREIDSEEVTLDTDKASEEDTLDAEKTSEEGTLDAEKASKEVTLDAEKKSKEDTLDTVSKIGEESQRSELLNDWTEDDSIKEVKEYLSSLEEGYAQAKTTAAIGGVSPQDANPGRTKISTGGDTVVADLSDRTVKRVHGERSEVAT